MDKATLFKIIDKTVQIRLNNILKSESFSKKIDEIVSKRLLTLILEGKKDSIKENKTSINKNNIPVKNNNVKKYTDDDILNKILNDTATDESMNDFSYNNSLYFNESQEDSSEEYDNVGNSLYSMINSEVETVKSKPIEKRSETVIINENTGKPLPNFLTKALTTNYRDKLKDMNERAEKFRNSPMTAKSYARGLKFDNSDVQ